MDALVARGDRVSRSTRRERRGDVRELVVDAADPDAVGGRAGRGAAGGWALRHVVAIAGGALPGEKTCTDPAELPLDAFRASLEHNLVTRVDHAAGRAAAPAAQHGDRSIALTTSTDALASYGLPAYAAAKAGLIGIVHALAASLAAEGIRINAVAPGDVPTPRNVREWGHVPGWYDGCARASRSGGWDARGRGARVRRADRAPAHDRTDARRRRRADAQPPGRRRARRRRRRGEEDR